MTTQDNSARRPLSGQTVMVTRPAHQNTLLAELLQQVGATVLAQPAIEIREPSDWGPVDGALANIKRYDWIVFSSANGVRLFVGRLPARGLDVQMLAHVRLAAIGPATVLELEKFGLQVQRQPERYQAEDLAAALAPDAEGKRFLLIRASRGREVLAETLRGLGAEVEQVVVYESVDVEKPAPSAAQALQRGDVDWITVTSSAIARSLAKMFPQDLSRASLASISPLTTAVLSELGFHVSAEAREATMQGVVNAIVEESNGAKAGWEKKGT